MPNLFSASSAVEPPGWAREGMEKTTILAAPTSSNAFERELLEIRERWNIAKHPFYAEFGEGRLPLISMAHLLAQQYHHIKSVLPSLALVYYKASGEHRNFILKQLVSEDGLEVDPANPSISSIEHIFRFCEAVGMSRSQVERAIPLPAWRARALFNINVAHEESFASYVAMKSVTEGQQWALNHECVLPALRRQGFADEDPAIGFFTGHFISNAEFGNSQISIATALLPDEGSRNRAKALAEETGRLFWASMNDLYRTVMQGNVDPMPVGVCPAGVKVS